MKNTMLFFFKLSFTTLIFLCSHSFVYANESIRDFVNGNINIIDGRFDRYNYYQGTHPDGQKIDPFDKNITWQSTRKFTGSWYGIAWDDANFTNLKFAGPSTTGGVKSAPMAVKKGSKTYFVINGSSELYPEHQQPHSRMVAYSSLAVMVASYDNNTGKVSAPVTVHVKGTGDGHDNAVINIDDQGHLYVFVSGRGRVRGGLIYRSNRAINDPSGLPLEGGFKIVYSDKFQQKDFCETGLTKTCQHRENNYLGFTYPQVWWIESKKKFLMVHTRYVGVYNSQNNNHWLPGDPNYIRATYTSWITPQGNDVVKFTTPRELIALTKKSYPNSTPQSHYFARGHYNVSKEHNGSVAIAFNVHLRDSNPKRYSPSDNRTNLYFMYTNDGDTWYNHNNELILSANDSINETAELKRFEVKEYQSIENNHSTESWCSEQTNSYSTVCRRVYLKDLDFRVDNQGKLDRAELLVAGNSSTTHGPHPSKFIADQDVYTSRFSLSDSQWLEERVTNRFANESNGAMLSGWPKIDHNYSSGAIKIAGNSVKIAVPIASYKDGFAGGERIALLNNPNGELGNWQSPIYTDNYQDPGYSDNNVRAVHHADGTSGIGLLWSRGLATGPNPDGSASQIYIGDWSANKAMLPQTDIVLSGKQLILATQDMNRNNDQGCHSQSGTEQVGNKCVKTQRAYFKCADGSNQTYGLACPQASTSNTYSAHNGLYYCRKPAVMSNTNGQWRCDVELPKDSITERNLQEYAYTCNTTNDGKVHCQRGLEYSEKYYCGDGFSIVNYNQCGKTYTPRFTKACANQNATIVGEYCLIP
ncbi:hypothetical protein [Pseudoalteromonas sp. MMG005]|uniref:hypothetical protein n=1 Tax=Pseudoalteromonas sp. MMG005 TaxID=2822682 RepID=UPI001B3A70C0|nr:hypothetical protein [Pseudoalteromonas sp. MMG005]MBQ4845909.1 hypothetical protein [Pseudoalteromonas sp. MMG005]